MMSRTRWLFVQAITMFILLHSISAIANNPFTGQFLADNRPRELIYVSITQAGNTVSGLMIFVSAKDNGKTEKTTLSLEGVADKTTITLREKRFFGDYVLTGRKQGNNLILAFPGKEGNVIPQTLTPTTESEYSAKLTQWQRLHADMYNEQSSILKHASLLSEQIYKIENTEIPKLLLEVSKALSDQKTIATSFKTKREHFQELASINLDNKCQYIYSEVAPFFYSDISSYFYSDFSPVEMEYQQAMSDISKRIENAPKVIAQVKGTSLLLKEALSKRKFPTPKLPKLPNENDEQKIFDNYISQARSSALEIESIKTQYASVANTVKEIICESERELKNMESTCSNQ